MFIESLNRLGLLLTSILQSKAPIDKVAFYEG